jgi:hypothetical protein
VLVRLRRLVQGKVAGWDAENGQTLGQNIQHARQIEGGHHPRTELAQGLLALGRLHRGGETCSFRGLADYHAGLLPEVLRSDERRRVPEQIRQCLAAEGGNQFLPDHRALFWIPKRVTGNPNLP